MGSGLIIFLLIYGLVELLTPKSVKVFGLLMKFIEQNPVEKIFLFEISRLGRTFLDTLILVKNLEERGIIVWSLSPAESWTRTEYRKIRDLMLSIFTWLANQERENLVERTKLGLKRARSEGEHIGRPYKEIPWKKYDELKGKGLGDAGISRIINVPYSTLRRKLVARRDWKISLTKC
jgi:Site-specific recombinases, DNA invertase Pin homologs